MIAWLTRSSGPMLKQFVLSARHAGYITNVSLLVSRSWQGGSLRRSPFTMVSHFLSGTVALSPLIVCNDQPFAASQVPAQECAVAESTTPTMLLPGHVSVGFAGSGATGAVGIGTDAFGTSGPNFPSSRRFTESAHAAARNAKQAKIATSPTTLSRAFLRANGRRTFPTYVDAALFARIVVAK